MRIALVVAVALVAVACGKSEEEQQALKPPVNNKLASLSYAEIPPSSGYALKTCVVHDKQELASLGKAPYVIAYQNYELRFCSNDCLNEFADDPETYTLRAHPKAIFNK